MPRGGWVARWVCVGVAIAAPSAQEGPAGSREVPQPALGAQHLAAGPAPAAASQGA